MASKNNASLYDVNLLIQAGINPKTGLPIKLGDIDDGFKPNNKKLLRIIDEQDAINRFTWYNLPNGLNGRLIERILYYKGQGMFFYMKEDDQFYFLPYTLDGSIDVYGRYTGVTPLPFNGKSQTGDKKESPWIIGLTRKPVYDIKLSELTVQDIEESCVLIKDYSEQISQTNIARQVLNDPLLDVMADLIPFMRTALLNGTGINGMKVANENEQTEVYLASKGVNSAALTGKKWIPIVGSVEFQELTSNNVAKAEEYLLALQSLDNYRLSLYGLDNGGLFQKKSHILEAEQKMNNGQASLPMQDSLKYRQDMCDIINSIWGLNVWVEINEAVIGLDVDGDGVAYDNDPQTPSYESEGGNAENVNAG